MANQSIFRVEVAGIFAVSSLYRFSKGIVAFWDRNDVNMVVHQCVRPNEHPMQFAGISCQAEINEAIRVIMEDVFFAVASLQDVMRTTWYNDASESHEGGPFDAQKATIAYLRDERTKSENWSRIWVIYASVPELVLFEDTDFVEAGELFHSRNRFAHREAVKSQAAVERRKTGASGLTVLAGGIFGDVAAKVGFP